MIKQFLIANNFSKVVRSDGSSLDVRLYTESEVRQYADLVLTAYEKTVNWRFERNVVVNRIADSYPPEWSFPLMQKS